MRILAYALTGRKAKVEHAHFDARMSENLAGTALAFRIRRWAHAPTACRCRHNAFLGRCNGSSGRRDGSSNRHGRGGQSRVRRRNAGFRGDGIVNGPEECDQGVQNGSIDGPDGCSLGCT